MHRVRRRTVSIIAVLAGAALGPAAGSAAGQADTEVVQLDRDMVRMDTVNLPGATAPVAQYMRDKLAPLGFEVDLIDTPVPGKTHLIARLRSANPTGKPVLLSAHADTVGVEPDLWSVDPFAGVIKGDHLYGRGSFDDKGGIAVFAAAAMRLARERVPLTRDIVLVFEADEEGGDHGIEWLAEHHWDKLDAAYSLNEGGIMSTGDDGQVDLAAVTVRDKISLSVVLRTRGVSTHSSRPHAPSAIDRLARALARVSRHRSAPRLVGPHAHLLPRAGAGERWPAGGRPAPPRPRPRQPHDRPRSAGAWPGGAPSARCSTRSSARRTPTRSSRAASART